jgi:hypothetical protein
MALYLISYDIAEKDSAEYQPLWDLLRSIGAVKILYSEWVVLDDAGMATTIYNRIAPLTRQADRLLVQEMGQNAAWDKLLISDEAFRKLARSARF